MKNECASQRNECTAEKKIIYIREQEFMTSQTQFYAGLFI